jgi:hypothetical protein
LLCPLLCGLFFFWKGAKGELSYKVKKRCPCSFGIFLFPCISLLLLFSYVVY